MRNFLWLGLLVGLASCHISMGPKVKGSGNVVKQSRDISGFTKLDVEGSVTVLLRSGNDFKVEVETDDNIVPYVETRKEGESLVISLKENTSFHNAVGINVLIQVPSLKEIDLSGSGAVEGTGQFYDPDKLKLSATGSGNITMNIKSPEVGVDIAGSGTIRLGGETRDLDIDIGGSGDYLGEGLKSENAKVSIGGSGTAKVFASISLKASIAGSGGVYYKGNPNVTKDIAGSGEVKSLE